LVVFRQTALLQNEAAAFPWRVAAAFRRLTVLLKVA
jgi:hypothetical protein